MFRYKEMSDVLQEGQIGEYKLEKFEVTNEYKFSRCNIPYGKYIRLINRIDCVMSDTPMEKRTNRSFIYKANGDVFIAGLGIGLIILAIQDKEDIKSITVLEKQPEIIELVGEQLPLNSRVKIIEGDVFNYEFPKGTKFDSIYFDIWNYVNKDIYKEMKSLKKKYRKYRRIPKENSNAFMSCWAEYEAKNNKMLY